jgi:hypothetical protein
VGERETSGSREMRRASTVTDPLTRTPVILFLLLRVCFPHVAEGGDEYQHARGRASCAAEEDCDVGERFGCEKQHHLSWAKTARLSVNFNAQTLSASTNPVSISRFQGAM